MDASPSSMGRCCVYPGMPVMRSTPGGVHPTRSSADFVRKAVDFEARGEVPRGERDGGLPLIVVDAFRASLGQCRSSSNLHLAKMTNFPIYFIWYS